MTSSSTSTRLSWRAAWSKACHEFIVVDSGDLRDADRRAFARRLDDQRQAQFGDDRHPVGRSVDDAIPWRRNAAREPHELGAPLVHRERRRHHAAARVGNPQGFERALHGAVFAEAPVERDERARVALAGELAAGCARPDRTDARRPRARAMPPARRFPTSARPRARPTDRPSAPPPCRNRVWRFIVAALIAPTPARRGCEPRARGRRRWSRARARASARSAPRCRPPWRGARD